MDDHRFDALAKAVARPPSRRRVLRALGGGGLLAGLGAALDRAVVAAQGVPCTLAFVGTVRLGPSAGQLLAGGTTPGELRGTLSFTADQSGAVSQGQLRLPDGTTLPVVGQVTGRAINLRLTGGPQQVVVAVGTAQQDLTTCQGAADGLLTGPQLGDLGDWHATLSGGGAGVGTAMAAIGGNPPATPTAARSTTTTMTTAPGTTTTTTPPGTATTTTTAPPPTTTPPTTTTTTATAPPPTPTPPTPTTAPPICGGKCPSGGCPLGCVCRFIPDVKGLYCVNASAP